MWLRKWLFIKNKTVTQMAKDMKVSRSYLNLVSLKLRRPSKKMAAKIEAFTEGQVSSRELVNVKLEMKK